jgi:hypothetical protein
MYAAFRKAHGALLDLKSRKRELTYEEFSSHDLQKEMARYEVPSGKQREILELLVGNRPMAISDLKNYLQVTAVQRAENKLNDARNLAYTNELYFLDEVIASVNELVDTCNAWLFSVEHPSDRGPDIPEPPTRAQMHDALDGLHQVLRSYLANTVIWGTSSKKKGPACEG